MAGTNLGQCANCGCPLDYDQILGGNQYCDDCLDKVPEENNNLLSPA